MPSRNLDEMYLFTLPLRWEKAPWIFQPQDKWCQCNIDNKMTVEAGMFVFGPYECVWIPNIKKKHDFNLLPAFFGGGGGGEGSQMNNFKIYFPGFKMVSECSICIYSHYICLRETPRKAFSDISSRE